MHPGIRPLVLTIVCFGLLLLPLAVVSTPDSAPAPGPLMPGHPALDDAVAFLLDHVDEDGCLGGARLTAWSVLALVATDHDPHAPTVNGASLVDGLKACEPGRVITNGEALTSLQRHVLAIVAASEDPTDFNGRNWIQEIRRHANASFGFMDPNNPNSHNNDMFGILALAAAGTPSDDGVIQAAADKLLSNQNNDGGWGFTPSGSSDTDMTGAALQALVIAERLDPGDEAAKNALAFLTQRAQDTDESDHPGCLSTGANMTNPDMDSTSWGLLGLLALQQDPRDNPWNQGGGPWQCLMDNQREDGGFPSAPSASTSPWPTTYVILALAGAPFGTLHDDAPRPQADITANTTPRVGEPLELHAEGVAFASWQQENGTIHSGTTIQWTPPSSGVHNFTLLLVDAHGRAATAPYPVLVEAETQEPPPTDEPTEPGSETPQNDPEPVPMDIDLAVNDTATTGETVTLQISTQPTAMTYRVDWGDGTLTDWASEDHLQHEYNEPGTYTISAWAQDENGDTHGPRQATIHVQATPESQEPQLVESPIGPLVPIVAFAVASALTIAHRKTRK